MDRNREVEIWRRGTQVRPGLGKALFPYKKGKDLGVRQSKNLTKTAEKKTSQQHGRYPRKAKMPLTTVKYLTNNYHFSFLLRA